MTMKADWYPCLKTQCAPSKDPLIDTTILPAPPCDLIDLLLEYATLRGPHVLHIPSLQGLEMFLISVAIVLDLSISGSRHLPRSREEDRRGPTHGEV